MMNENLYEDISKRINRLFGIYLKQNNWSSMEKNLVKAARLLKRKEDIEEISKWVLKPLHSSEEYHALARNLTIGETYFFRELSGLTLLTDEIIPEIRKNNRKTLKIWSAGCSSGEEPYSIAVFLKENLWDSDQWDIQITATDLNNEALSKARKGIYRPWSFRGFREELLRKYFVCHANTYEIRKDIRDMIRFRNLNLVKDAFPRADDKSEGFDAIFCRNVLMYFSKDAIEDITKKFFSSLADNGWLITSQTELSMNIHHQFRRTKFKDAFFFKKGNVPPTDITNNFRKMNLPEKSAPANRPSSVLKRKPTLQDKYKQTTISKQQSTSPAANEVSAPDIKKLYNHFEYKKIIAVYEAAESAAGFDATDLFLISKSYANMGRYREGADIIQDLINKNSSNPVFYYFYATILSEQGSWGEAEKNLIKALYLKPDFLSARFSYFLVLKKRNKHEKAIKEGQNILHDIEMYDNNDVLTDMEGMTAGSLRQTIDLMQP
ncbi:MAG: CheR family methyltransferase [Bacteroidales bacterium]|nr:CheR family methyltransferase [Bacteroidales bacterium]